MSENVAKRQKVDSTENEIPEWNPNGDDNCDGAAALKVQQKQELATASALHAARVPPLYSGVTSLQPAVVSYQFLDTPKPVSTPVVHSTPAPSSSSGSGFVFAVPQRANQPGSKADREKAAGISEAAIEEPKELGKVKFLGFVDCMQSNGQTQKEQDATLHRVVRNAHGAKARACFWREYEGKVIEGLPEKNTASKWCIFAGEGSVGGGGPLSKKAVTNGAKLDGSSDNPYATLGNRVTPAVTVA